MHNSKYKFHMAVVTKTNTEYTILPEISNGCYLFENMDLSYQRSPLWQSPPISVKCDVNFVI